jgi:hypothetical protein
MNDLTAEQVELLTENISDNEVASVMQEMAYHYRKTAPLFARILEIGATRLYERMGER